MDIDLDLTDYLSLQIENALTSDDARNIRIDQRFPLKQLKEHPHLIPVLGLPENMYHHLIMSYGKHYIDEVKILANYTVDESFVLTILMNLYH